MVMLIIAAILIGLTGCDVLANLLGGGATVDLTVTITFTNDNIIVTIRNNGSQSVVNVPFTVYLSTDTLIFPDDHAVYSAFIDVGAGLSSPMTVATSQFDLAGILNGDYYIGVIVDPQNIFGETDDTNNKGFASVTFAVTGGTGGGGGGGGTTGGADLVIDSVVFDSSNLDNFVVSFSNNGTVDTADVELSAFLSGNTTLDSGDPTVFNASIDGSGYLNVGAGASGSVTIFLDDLNLGGLSLSDGYYYLIAEINSDNYIVETDSTNNTGYDASWGVPVYPSDSYEPDDGFGSANSFVIGSPQTHSITAADIDWFSVTLNSGTAYTIQTSSPGGGDDVDTYMYLIAGDGSTVIDENDDFGAGTFSQVIYSPSSTGTYYVAIEGFSPVDGGYYQLSVIDPNAPGTVDVTIQ